MLVAPPNQVKAKVDEMGLPVTFHDAIDHAELGKYKVRSASFPPPTTVALTCGTETFGVWFGLHTNAVNTGKRRKPAV